MTTTLRRALLLVTALACPLTVCASAQAALSGTPDATWMTNGTVRAVVQAGNVIYIAGQFTSVRPCAPPTACSGSYPVQNVAALDANTGAGIRSFRPLVTGDSAVVYALAVAGGRVFIGGHFTGVGGQPRANLAAVDAATGAVDPTFDP